MKRAVWLLPVPLLAIAVAVLAPRAPGRRAPVKPVAEETKPATVATAPTWVATKIPPRPPRAALLAAAQRDPREPKPMTRSREALLDSRVPVVAALSVDQLGSPRERPLAARGGGEARQAQLDRLNDRPAAHLEKLRAARNHATGEERARLTRAIKTLEKNQSLRSRVITATVHVPARPGTSIAGLDIPAAEDKQPSP